MKLHYVKTSNHKKFMAGISKIEIGAAREARIILLSGDPGTGKSRCVDHFGAERDAVHIEGIPGMTVGYLRELLAFDLGCSGGSKFQQEKSIKDLLAQRTTPTVILDEAQHGLERKADCIEYLRRLCDLVGSVLVLVCHTSERGRFSENKLAHIATRISAQVEFKPATVEDVALYLSELCEVKVDDDVVAQAVYESSGRYRLLTSACRTLEVLAQRLGKTTLTAEDVKGITLCEDAMRNLRKMGKS
jgi:hypothetical protein